MGCFSSSWKNAVRLWPMFVRRQLDVCSSFVLTSVINAYCFYLHEPSSSSSKLRMHLWWASLYRFVALLSSVWIGRRGSLLAWFLAELSCFVLDNVWYGLTWWCSVVSLPSRFCHDNWHGVALPVLVFGLMLCCISYFIIFIISLYFTAWLCILYALRPTLNALTITPTWILCQKIYASHLAGSDVLISTIWIYNCVCTCWLSFCLWLIMSNPS